MIGLPGCTFLINSVRIGPVLSKNLNGSLLLNLGSIPTSIVISMGSGISDPVFLSAMLLWIGCALTDLIITPSLVKKYNQRILNKKEYPEVEINGKMFELGLQIGGHYNKKYPFSTRIQADDGIIFDS